ncbi:hypothetical protein [Chryseobacterium sp.]|uniref:hypothetical protein n=1 Tax=Chryseobacterium sp. TaxID=1871047 RepID=UPI0011C7316F|nr:hypothetical protein [Chryseobacterium sp.]TXF76023.1 hypothetical protein FUA25_08985 [Chryseobacterium sp.]
MQNLQDIQEKIFFESKSILESLSKIASRDELLARQDLFAELSDRIAFLRILEKNKEAFVAEIPVQNAVINITNQQNEDYRDEQYFEDLPHEDDVIEEEVMFTNELNDIGNRETFVEREQEENGITEHQEQESLTFDDLAPENVFGTENEEAMDLTSGFSDEKEITEQDMQQEDEEKVRNEKEFLEMEENRRKIIEFEREETGNPQKPHLFEDENEAARHHAEKKFKLAHIKGLKAVQNLFDEDPLENIREEELRKPEQKSDSGSILKTNISTDFMEAEKRKPDFRLDLNDKVSFTKILFNGNEEDLKSTIAKLNTFDNLEEAKQYLSDTYYQKNWSKNDELAQRLWSLVEGKFL